MLNHTMTHTGRKLKIFIFNGVFLSFSSHRAQNFGNTKKAEVSFTGSCWWKILRKVVRQAINKKIEYKLLVGSLFLKPCLYYSEIFFSLSLKIGGGIFFQVSPLGHFGLFMCTTSHHSRSSFFSAFPTAMSDFLLPRDCGQEGAKICKRGEPVSCSVCTVIHFKVAPKHPGQTHKMNWDKRRRTKKGKIPQIQVFCQRRERYHRRKNKKNQEQTETTSQEAFSSPKSLIRGWISTARVNH